MARRRAQEDDDDGTAIVAELEPQATFQGGRSRVSGIKKWLAKPHRQCSYLRLTILGGSDASHNTTLMEWERGEIRPALADDIVGMLQNEAMDTGGSLSAQLTQHVEEDGRIVATKNLEWRAIAGDDGAQLPDGSPRAWGEACMRHVETMQRVHNSSLSMLLQQMAQTNAIALKAMTHLQNQLHTERTLVAKAREGELIARVQAAEAELEKTGEDGAQDAELLKETLSMVKMALMSANQKAPAGGTPPS